MATDTERETPRRLRAADVIAEQRRVIELLTQRGGGENSSVTLSRNAKGETQIEVTVRTDSHNIPTAEAARMEAARIYVALCTEFAAGSGRVWNAG